MIQRVVISLLLSLALLGAPAFASAQCNPEADGARLLEKYERATEIVRSSQSMEARKLMETAQRRLEEARRFHQENRGQLACASLAAANSLIDKAVQIAQATDRAADRVEEDLTRIQQLLIEIQDLVRECGSSEAERMLEGALRQLKRAWGEYRDGDMRAAVAFSRSAETQGRRARRFCEGDLSIDRQTLQIELERTDLLIADVAERLGSSGNQRDPLGPSRELQAQAWEYFHTDRLLASATLTRRARDLARNAARRDGDAVSAREIEGLIDSTTRLVEQLNERAEEVGHDQARRLLSQATRLLTQARTALVDQDLRRALGSARTASALTQDVAEMLGEIEE